MSDADDLLRLVVLVVAIVLLAPVVLMLFMTPMMGTHGWWADGTVGTGWGWLFAWLFPLVVVVAISYLLYRVAAGAGSATRDDDAAIEELRVAYARGEISDEEFEERRTRLQREE